MIKGGKSRKNKAGLQCLGSTVLSHLLLQFRGAATTVGSQFPFQEADFPESVVTSGIHRRRQWARGGRGFKGANHSSHWEAPRMEGQGVFVPHLMEEEGPEGEIGSMVKEGYGCTRENDISMKEDDSFEKEDDTCNTTSSFSPSPAVSRRITMGVRGIRALEEWCRRAVQVIHKQMSLQNHRHSSSYD